MIRNVYKLKLPKIGHESNIKIVATQLFPFCAEETCFDNGLAGKFTLLGNILDEIFQLFDCPLSLSFFCKPNQFKYLAKYEKNKNTFLFKHNYLLIICNLCLSNQSLKGILQNQKK